VEALDKFDNLATGYSGTIHFTSSDGQAVPPANATLTNGTASFTVTFKTVGSQTLVATDTAVSTIAGSTTVNITAAAASHFSVNVASTATAGTTLTYAVTALDPFNNTDTGYAGSVHFTSSDGAAVLPANQTLTSGAGTFSITFKTAGSQTITATDSVSGTITGTSGAVAVSPAALDHLAITAPSTTIAGSSITYTVTAQDQFNNTVTGYTGTIHFSSNDAAAALPS